MENKRKELNEVWMKIVSDIKSDNKLIRQKANEMALTEMDQWIFRIASQKFPTFMERYKDDMMQEGRLAVLEHLREYDGVSSSPTNFFYFHILHALHEFSQKYGMKVSRHYGDVLNAIHKSEIYPDEKGEYDIEELYKITKISKKTLKKALECKKMTTKISIESCIYQYSDEASDPFENTQKREIKKLIELAVLQLAEEERIVIEMYYGVCGSYQYSIREISEKTGWSIEECQRLIYAGRRHLKNIKNIRNKQ